MSPITFRDAQPDDVPAIYEMLRASADEQGFPDSLAVTHEDLLQDGWGQPQPRFAALLAQAGVAPAGMAVYFFNYSTWGSRTGLYLEDLYVVPEFRKQGVARGLMTRLAGIARGRECGRFQWVVHAENAAAIKFYESMGASLLPEWRLMSVNGSSIERLADAP